VTVAIWILAALCVVGFVQAMLLFPKVMNRGNGESGTADLTDPTQREVVVYVSLEDPPLVLKPTLDLPDAAALDAKLLDRALFPGGKEHRWYVLQTMGPDQEPVVLDLRAEPPVFSTPEGLKLSPVGIGADRPAGWDTLPPYLRMLLTSLRFGEAEVVLDPEESPRVLLAYPAAAIPGPYRAHSARMGGRDFVLKLLPKDDLDTELEGGGELLRAKKP